MNENHSFAVSLYFEVENVSITELSIVFNEGYLNEFKIEMYCPDDASVSTIQESDWFSPSFLMFEKSESKTIVHFSIDFHENDKGNRQTQFIECVWELANYGFRPSEDDIEEDEAAGTLFDIMDELEGIESTSQIDVTRYWGKLF